MKIKRIDKFDQVTNFLNNNFSSPTHWHEWNKIVSKYFNTDFFYWGYLKKSELIGVCPIHKTQNGILNNLYSGQFHFIPYGGWIFKEKIKFDVKKIPLKFNQAFNSFVLPTVGEYNATYKQSDNEFSTLIIDLEKSEDEIWMSDVNSKRRNMIRKAKKNGLSVIINNKSIDNFYSFYNRANSKNKLESLPVDFFRELNDNKYNINVNYLWAMKGNDIFGITVVVNDKNYALYWLGIGVENTLNLGQGELLQWEAIKISKMNGCRYYDLCYIEKERLPNIYEFKKGFSNTEINVPLINKKTFSYKIINKISKWF